METGVWLRAKNVMTGVRDGRTHADPMLAVLVEQPTFFAKRSAAEFGDDRDVVVVTDQGPPPANYHPETWDEAKARIKDHRRTLKAEAASRAAAQKQEDDARATGEKKKKAVSKLVTVMSAGAISDGASAAEVDAFAAAKFKELMTELDGKNAAESIVLLHRYRREYDERNRPRVVADDDDDLEIENPDAGAPVRPTDPPAEPLKPSPAAEPPQPPLADEADGDDGELDDDAELLAAEAEAAASAAGQPLPPPAPRRRRRRSKSSG